LEFRDDTAVVEYGQHGLAREFTQGEHSVLENLLRVGDDVNFLLS
jgi:hypothetical protein